MSDELRPNVIANLSDDELWDSQLALALACGRNHGAVSKKQRRQWYCFLFAALTAESDYRGVQSPTPPYHPGDFTKGQAL